MRNLNERSRVCTQAQTLDPYILTNANGLEARILPYGAIVQKLLVPDSSGVSRDVVLGFDKLAPYEASCTLDHHTCFCQLHIRQPVFNSAACALAQDGTSPYFGALVGRVANRIADATFQLDGKTYHVTPNEMKTSLHGGKFGFSRHLWEGQPFTSQLGSGIKLRYHSPDGDEVRHCT